jgi:hypothetical protein
MTWLVPILAVLRTPHRILSIASKRTFFYGSGGAPYCCWSASVCDLNAPSHVEVATSRVDLL